MNLLITGGLGHIGSKLIDNLKNIKTLKKVVVIDDAKSNNLNILFNYNNRKIKIFFIKGDLLNKKIFERIKFPINCVIHLASITNAEESFKIKKFLIKNNFGIFKNIVKFCINQKSKLVHISSTSVYGEQINTVDENCKDLRPLSPYAEVKLKEEKLLKKTNIDFVTLRFGTISGFSKGMRFHTAVNKFCFNAILNEPIPIWTKVIDLYRPYLSLTDATKAIFFVINKNIFNKNIYNVLTKNYTVRQILEIIRSKKIKVKIKYTKSPIINQKSYYVSNYKFKKLKFNFSLNIKKDIFETLQNLKGLKNHE